MYSKLMYSETPLYDHFVTTVTLACYYGHLFCLEKKPKYG